MLYISIATTNPLAVRLCLSSRASQQATPSASNATEGYARAGNFGTEQQPNDNSGHG
jgi:hypothetical protein